MQRFWVYNFPDGVRRARGSVVNDALRDGTIENADIFFERGTTTEEIKDYLEERGIDRDELDQDE
jgi:hypothetical protein